MVYEFHEYTAIFSLTYIKFIELFQICLTMLPNNS